MQTRVYFGLRFALSALMFSFIAQGETVDFVNTIHPLLAQRCGGCHGGANPQAGLLLTSRSAMLKGGVTGPAMIPGRSADSLLIKRVTGAVSPAMPLGGPKLSDTEIKALADWIDENAPWVDTEPKAAAISQGPLAPRRPAVPESKYSNPIDKFIDAYFRQKGLPFTAPAPDDVFVHRAYLDIWGLPPSAKQVTEFLSDVSPGKREKLIDTLLEHSGMYAGNWISFWNDLLRNDQGVNYAGLRKSITPWLYSALNQNLPYNEMVSDLLNPAKDTGPEGFLLGVNWRGAINASQTPFMQAAQNTAQIFLGVNLKCASCHDSFINRYKLRQSYAMAALFTEQSKLELVRCDVKTGKFTGPEFLFPEVGSVPEGGSAAERHAIAAKLFTSPRNGRLARTMANRIWGRFFDYGLVEPVDEMDNKSWNPDLLDWLASDFSDHDYDLKHLLRQIMTSRTYQLPSIAGRDEKGKEYTFRGPRPRRITAEQFVDTVSALTGEWRIAQTDQGATFVREWQLKSTPLSRALGRPIRDQVFTTRNPDATTLQALEMVNGDTLSVMLRRGARRLLGELPPPPSPVFDSKTLRKGSRELNVDVTGVKKLWLVLTDVDCYDPSRTLAGWADVELSGPKGVKKLGELTTLSKTEIKPLTSGKMSLGEGLTPGVPSTLIYDIEGLGFTKMHGQVAVDDSSVRDDIMPSVRFFVFAAEPDRHQLVAVTGEPPVRATPPARDADSVVTGIFLQAFCRKPSPDELRLARQIAAPDGKITPNGLEDLLWSVLMHPELQYIY